MGFEDFMGLRGRDGGVDHRDRFGSFGVEDAYNNRKSGVGASRAWYDTDSDSGEIESVVEAARMVYSMRNKESGVRDMRVACLRKRVGGEIERNGVKSDDFVNFEKNVMGHVYEFGDMVWGKVKSYPWWPGQVFDEEFSMSCVRETKREGHVLVAFFGDGSYGWLDPTELVPFDSHYVEKSKQTNAKVFLKAVEEAEDEVRRRAALGLSCPCRSRYNFRPMHVDGVLQVDICGYEAGGLYTVQQIKSTRAAFYSLEMLDFVKQLALMPCMNFNRSVPWIKNVATLLAYRRAVFKEHDETYFKALGVRTAFPANSRVVLARRVKLQSQAEESNGTYMKANSRVTLAWLPKVPSQASLSVRLEVATSPGTSKIPGEPTVVDGRCLGDKHLFEQNDKPDVSKTHYVSEGQQYFSIPSHEDVVFAAANLVLQERDAPVIKKTEFSCGEDHLASKEITTMEKKAELERINLVDAKVDRKLNCTALVGGSPFSQLAKPRYLEVAENYNGLDKKPKVCKRPRKEFTSEQTTKKTKKDTKLEAGIRYQYKCNENVGYETLPRQSAGKSYQKDVLHEENLLMDQDGKSNMGCLTISPDSLAKLELIDPKSIKMELPRLFDLLLSLAVNPFHGLERYSFVNMLQFFLQFLSFASQKDSVLAPLSESSNKYVTCTEPAKSSNGECARDLPSASKPPKKRHKHDDYVKFTRENSVLGVKELSSKGSGKPNEQKSLSSEKKVGNEKPLKSQERGREETDMKVPSRPIQNSITKVAAPRRFAKPTLLLMQFPRQSALPSVPELKARFVRFGPFHHSPRVFWKSSTCRIVFKYESDAQVARRYAVQNRSLFGDVKVLYDVQVLQVPFPVFSKSSTQSLDESFNKVPQQTSASTGYSTESRSSVLWEQQLPSIHRKSCLKKQQDEETESVMSRSRVKFMLGEDRSNSKTQQAINSIVQNPFSNHPNDISSSSLATLDGNETNFKKVALPLPSWMPPSHWISNMPENHEVYQYVQACNQKHLQLEERNNHMYTFSQNTDVSGKMLKLLTRCTSLLTDLKNSLGYVPYHL